MERPGKYPRLSTLAATVLVIGALYLARSVLVPFVLAVLVSFLVNPLVLRLQRWHFSRLAAVVTAVLLVAVAASATSWLMVGQVREVTSSLSEYKQNIRGKIATLRGVLAQPVRSAMETVEDLGGEPEPEAETGGTAIQAVRIVQPARGPFEVLRDASRPVLDSLLTAVMVLLFAFVMLLRRDDLGDRLIRMMGSGRILVTTRALEEAARKVSSYLWRLLLLNSLHGLAVGIGLLFIGVPNALLWGLLSMILRFIPYLGPWTAATFPVLIAMAVSTGWSQPLFTIGLFVVLELISNNVLEPWLQSRGTGISPLAILGSALFWTWLWGPVGLVLSTPLTVCLVVMGKYVPQLRFLPLLFGDAPGLSPPARLYQRLIAGDQDQSWLVLRAEIAQQALHEAYDSVLLPALSMAEHDRLRGAFDDEAEAHIEETLKLLIEEASELSTGLAVRSEATPGPVLTQPLRVYCIPARGTADALAAAMLRQVLERDGATVEIAPVGELSGATLDLLQSHNADIVCISAVPPSRFLHVRQLCKRIASRFPGLPIVAGMWTHEPEARDLGDPLRSLPGLQVVASLGEARIHVRQLAETAGVRRQAGLPVPAAPSA